MTKPRSKGKPFQPGQSGNPGGRPKLIAPIRDLAREHSTEAITTLVTILQDAEQPGACRVAAAREILDRGWGKSIQAVELDGAGPLQIIFSTAYEPRPGEDA